MARYTYFAVIAALCLTVASATTQTASFGSQNFANTPGVTFDASTTTSTDYTASTGWQIYNKVIYGPGATNSTVYAYAVLNSHATMIIRTLNATLLSNSSGTAAKVGDAKISDTTLSPAPTLVTTTTSVPVYGVGLGAFAIAYVQAVSSCNQVFLQIIQGTTSLVTKQVTSNTCVDCSTANAAGSSYDYLINNVFYENNTFYIAYTTILTATPYTSSCGTATEQVLGYLQGFTVSNSADKKWTNPATIYTGTAATTADPTAAEVGLLCGPQNYTNSTNLYCVYKDAASAGTANLKSVAIPTETGTAAGASTIATDVTGSGTNYPVKSYAFTAAGFVYGLYQQGILINNATTSVDSASSTTYANTLQFYNLTASSTPTPGGVAITGLTNTNNGYTWSGAGITYSQGFVILSTVQTGTSAVSYDYSPFFANATLNGTKKNAGSTGTSATGYWFADDNGALWFGANTYDDASPNTVLSGSAGQLIGQLNYSAGNVLASFFALLSLMIAALFAF